MTNAADWINLTNLFSVNDDYKHETYDIFLIELLIVWFASLWEICRLNGTTEEYQLELLAFLLTLKSWSLTLLSHIERTYQIAKQTRSTLNVSTSALRFKNVFVLPLWIQFFNFFV